MARSGGRASLIAVVITLALLAIPLPALATFDINIFQSSGAYFNGGAGITIADNGSGDLLTTSGTILVVTGAGGLPALPGFSLGLGLAQSNSPGGPGGSVLDLIYAATSDGTGGTVQLTASATGYTFPPGSKASRLTSVVSGDVTGGSVTAQQWANLNNTLFGMGVVTPGVQGPFSTPGFTNTAFTGFVSSTPYSITDRVILTLGASGSTGGDLRSTATPEPITMFLGGTGLLVFAYVGRRRLFGR